jgi:hypothetical protein
MIEQVGAFVRSREVELVLARPPAGADLFLKASYDGEGFFFGIAFKEVDYVCIPGMGQFENSAKQLAEFRSLAG